MVGMEQIEKEYGLIHTNWKSGIAGCGLAAMGYRDIKYHVQAGM